MKKSQISLKSDVLALIVATLGIFIFLFIIFTLNTWSPYHVDSALYGLSAKEFLKTKHLICTFHKRCMTCYTYAFLALIFGISGAHKAFVVISLLLLIISVYLVVHKLTENKFWSLVAILTSCSTVSMIMSTTIGKEAPFSLGLFLLSLYLGLSEKLFLSFIGGILWSLSLQSKQTVYLISPLLVLLLLKHKFNKNIWLFIIGSMPINILFYRDILTTLTYKNPNLGVFYGPFSHMQIIGLKLMYKGLHFAGLTTLLFAIVSSIRKKDYIAFIFLADIFWLIIFLTNISVAHYRHFLWPGIIASILLSYNLSKINYLETKKLVVSAIALILCLYEIHYLYPNLEIKSINLPQKYAIFAAKTVKKPAIILGMDNCGLVRYYTNLKCIGHPAYPFMNWENVEQNLNHIKKLLDTGYNLYIYPDFFAYDPKGFYRKAFLSKFKLKKVNSNWFEDYHRVYIYPQLGNFIKNYRKIGSVSIYGFRFNLYSTNINNKKIIFLGYKKIVTYGIYNVPLYKILN